MNFVNKPFRFEQMWMKEMVAHAYILALDNLQEYHRSCPCPTKNPFLPHLVISSNGSPPPEKDWVKVSIDGAMFEEKKFARLEAIVRNNNGLVMTIYFSQLIPLPSLVKMMEVLVACRAIWFAKE